MESFNNNGLVMWNEEEIQVRQILIEIFSKKVQQILLGMNKAWQFYRIETPVLIPHDALNPAYSLADVYGTTDLLLRPETTYGSYEYAKGLLQFTPCPIVVWQSGLSFRREQDQVMKNMRLKQFYQQEFQCFFTKDTLNDYHTNILLPLQMMFEWALKLPIQIVESDRLPIYSQKTIDFMGNGMELCSCSLRNDFDMKIKKYSQRDQQFVKRELWVLEIAIGLDRCVYQWMNHALAS